MTTVVHDLHHLLASVLAKVATWPAMLSLAALRTSKNLQQEVLSSSPRKGAVSHGQQPDEEEYSHPESSGQLRQSSMPVEEEELLLLLWPLIKLGQSLSQI